MDYYLAIDGQPHGPFSADEVRGRIAAGTMQPEDYCWCEGWSDWRTLRDVFPGETAALTPPPLPAWAAQAAPVRPRHLPQRRDQMTTGIFVVLAGLAALVTVVLIVGSVISEDDTGAGSDEDAMIDVPSQGREAATRAQLREMQFEGENLEQIAQACLVYAQANGGRLPTYSEQLRPLFGARFAAVMDVPETREVEASGYVVRMGLDLSMPDDTPIAFEARPRVDGARAVAFLDGSVRVLRRGDPVLTQALSR